MSGIIDSGGVDSGDYGTPVEATNHSMRKHAPELDQLLRKGEIAFVHAEYSGADARGGFDVLRFTRIDGVDCHVMDGPRNVQLKALFRALLLARHPDWCRDLGSCGDFRWNVHADSLAHSHYVLRGEGNERITHHSV